MKIKAIILKRLLLLAILFALALSGCGSTASGPSRANGKLDLVATTTIVADVVRNVAGDYASVTSIVPVNVDEHSYDPTPQDVAHVSRADLVFMNGAGLEPFIEKLMTNAGTKTPLISVSKGIVLIQSQPEDEMTGTPAATQTPGVLTGMVGDPHVWMDPNNVLVWIDNIERALIQADPQHAGQYKQNADQYRQQIKALDSWIRDQVAQIPPARRQLVTDHLIFTYFAKEYGFTQVGAAVPGYSSLAASSAQQQAVLEDAIRKYNVPAIFVGNTVNPALSERIAQDTHTKLVHILTGSLTGPDGPAPTYIAYIKYNVTTITAALKVKDALWHLSEKLNELNTPSAGSTRPTIPTNPS